MDLFKRTIRLDQPARYEIKVQGRMERDLTDWFQGMVDSRYEAEDGQPGKPGVTTLSGVLADQPALHGLLNYIRDLGLILLYVECLDAHYKQDGDRPGSDLT